MYRTLLVEDETDIRRGLLTWVDWQAYGMEVVFDAPNGRVALEYLNENPIDIVITDVVMPLMDGIELIQRVREYDPTVKVVFISGYQDMEYIKGAFKVSAVDYIFKPVDLEELDAVLKRVAAACAEDENERAAMLDAQKRADEGLAIRRQVFLARLLGNTDGAPDLRDAAELGLGWMADSSHAVLAVRAARPRSDRAPGPYAAVQDALDRARASEPPETRECLSAVPTGLGVAVVVSGGAGGERGRTAAVARSVLEGLSLHWTVAIGIGPSVTGLAGLAGSYSRALRAAEESFYFGFNTVYDFSTIGERVEADAAAAEAATRRVVDVVRRGARSDVRPSLKAFIRSLSTQAPHDPQVARALCTDLLLRLASAVREIDEEAAAAVTALERDGLRAARTLDEVYSTIAGPLEKTAVQVAATQSTRSGFLTEKMKAELRSNLAADITIEQLANRFLLTPNYVSTLFKRETGMTVHDYLTEARIDRAKELLADPRLKLYDIASAVGYRDRDYFTRVFRKRVGVTPKEYRDRELAGR